MNKIFGMRIIGALVVCSLLSFSVRETNYFVVIGAFAKETNAEKFTGYARNLYLKAYYKFNPERNLYYVHVMETPKKDDARNWTLYLKNETRFKDAWVFTDANRVISAGDMMAQSDARQTSARYSGNEVLSEAEAGAVAYASTDMNVNLNYVEESRSVDLSEAWTNSDQLSYTSNLKNYIKTGQNFKLEEGEILTFTAETSDGKTIPTEVMLVDYKKAKKITGFNTGELIGLRGKTRNQTLTFVCDIFGYSVETQVLNLDKLSRARDVRQNNNGVWEVKFKLKPMKENEISILYNTVFFPDAAVLRPSSKKQLDEVLELMKAYPSYKILLHSHCNQGGKREIKLPGENNLYFDIEGAIQKSGSDKQLTKQRGETIKSYLVDNGIEGKRISVFGWGSAENLVSSSSADTAINDRIEVELLQN